jgi:predicted GIY-YIG superfamily endonuclease
MSTTVYVLRLQHGKYYVGKTDDVQRRFQQHQNGRGSGWTQKYPPIAIEKTYPRAGPFDEDKVTKEYMAKHGIDNVRGGTYVSVELDEYQTEVLKQEIWSATDCCTRCGRKGHFVKDCYARSTVNGEEFEDEDEDEEDEDDDEEDDDDDEEDDY